MDLNDFTELQGVRIFPAKDCTAVFLCCEGKTLLIQTEPQFAEIAPHAMRRRAFPRPQTFELLHAVCRGFEITPEAGFITECRDNVYFARIVFSMKNELGTKKLEADARPSDMLLQSFLARMPVFIARSVLEKSEDATPLMRRAMQREERKND